MWFLLLIVVTMAEGPRFLHQGPFLTEQQCLLAMQDMTQHVTRPAEQKLICILTAGSEKEL